MDDVRKIIDELVKKYGNDNVGFVLACENHRMNLEMYEKITSSDEYRKARKALSASSS